jgi:hypothetical protein
MWGSLALPGPGSNSSDHTPKHGAPGSVLLVMEIDKLYRTALIAFDATWPCRQRARNCRKAQSCLGHLRSMGRNICYPSPLHSCKPGVRTCSAFSLAALWRFFQRSLSHHLTNWSVIRRSDLGNALPSPPLRRIIITTPELTGWTALCSRNPCGSDLLIRWFVGSTVPLFHARGMG